MGIDILVPVLGRPENAKPLIDSLKGSTKVPYRVLFLCSPGDDAQIDAAMETGCETTVVPWNAARGDYPRKINQGFRLTANPWVFTGADDIRFRKGWAEAALATGKRVVGTNDLGNPEARRRKRFSTHCIVARSYVEERGTIDGPGQVFSEQYDHNWCDRELAATAIFRGEWAYAHHAVVEHLHFHWGKGAEDATYTKGLKNFAHDRKVFSRRMKRARIPIR